MAASYTKQLIADGARNYIIKLSIVSDVAAELTSQLAVNTTGDLLNDGRYGKLLKVDAALSGFSATLFWDATADVRAAEITADSEVHLDFRCIGGLPNNAGAGKTGDMLFSTNGLGNGDTGFILLHFKK